VQLFTHLYVREDALRLYGFATEAERAMFELLLGVSGIGSSLALTILSGIPAEELVKAIAEHNTSLLQAIKGIGKKTAERVVLELKEKVGSQTAGLPVTPRGVAADAVAALESLGVPGPRAEKAVAQALEKLGTDSSVEAVVRAALKLI